MSGGYKVEYLSIKNDYDIKCSTDSMSNPDKLNEQILKVDAANNHRTNPVKDNRPDYCFSNGTLLGMDSGGIQYYKRDECITTLSALTRTETKWNNDGPTVGGVKYGGCDAKNGSNGYSWNCRIAVSGNAANAQPTPFDNTEEVKTAFKPIAQYYANLTSIKNRLQTFLKESSQEVSDGQEQLLHEERYMDSVYPERSMKARESSYGLLPELKTRTIPILVSVGAAMLAFAIVLSFQLMGVTGQVSLSPAYLQAYATFQATVMSITNNTAIVGGFAGICLVIAMYFAYLYTTSLPRQ
jgi:hypothetical protein